MSTAAESSSSMLPVQQERTVIASFVQLYVSFAVKHGLDPEALCAAAGCTTSQLSVGDQHVPYAWLYEIRKAVIAQLPEVMVGLEIGLFASLDLFGYGGQAVKYARSSREALHVWNEILMRYHRGVPEYPRIIETSGVVSWHLPPQIRAIGEPHESIEAVFVGILATMRSLTGVHLVPFEVRFASPRKQLARAFEAYFGGRVCFFADEDAIYFERSMLELPFRHADALAGQRFRQAFERRMAAEGDPFAVAVQNAIAAHIASGDVSQAGIAKQFAMTPRTLQRRLRERNLHYQELLLEARKQAALRLLAERSRSVCEVAMAIGYEVSSFNRQFRRWTGMTPSAFRNAQAFAALR